MSGFINVFCRLNDVHTIRYWGIVAQWDIRSKRILNPNLVKSHLPIVTCFAITESFQSLHWARQYHCRALCKFQNDWTTETNVENEWELTRFEFKISYGLLGYIAETP